MEKLESPRQLSREACTVQVKVNEDSTPQRCFRWQRHFAMMPTLAPLVPLLFGACFPPPPPPRPTSPPVTVQLSNGVGTDKPPWFLLPLRCGINAVDVDPGAAEPPPVEVKPAPPTSETPTMDPENGEPIPPPSPPAVDCLQSTLSPPLLP